ncbi:hypothetical protein HDV05_002386 [Chytridiales sp. JEL 0842]|nr:hypothetical protein HDV05_002386 [Chytridiales sp. JEL 0842]
MHLINLILLASSALLGFSSAAVIPSEKLVARGGEDGDVLPQYPFIADWDAGVSECLYNCYFETSAPSLSANVTLHAENEEVRDIVCSPSFLSGVLACDARAGCVEGRAAVRAGVNNFCEHINEHLAEQEA